MNDLLRTTRHGAARSIATCAAAGLLAALVHGAACGADAPASPGTRAAALLDADGLKRCLLEKHRIEQAHAALSTQLVSLEGARSQLLGEADAMRREPRATDADGVAARAARVERLQASEASFNAQVDEYTAQVRALEQAAQANAAACGQRRYRPADLDAIRDQLPPGAAPRAASEPR